MVLLLDSAPLDGLFSNYSLANFDEVIVPPGMLLLISSPYPSIPFICDMCFSRRIAKSSVFIFTLWLVHFAPKLFYIYYEV